MKYIYMNEHIKEKEPKEPVITVFDPDTKDFVYTDKVVIKDREGNVVGRVMFHPKGIKKAPHHVRVAVEIYDYEGGAQVDFYG